MCVVCRAQHAKNLLVRLVRRPDGRIGWPDSGHPLRAALPPAEGERPSPSGEDHKKRRRGSRGVPTGKGLYVCRGGDCLVRLLSEKRFKRMFADAMEAECRARLSALLAPPEGPVGLSASLERTAGKE